MDKRIITKGQLITIVEDILTSLRLKSKLKDEAITEALEVFYALPSLETEIEFIRLAHWNDIRVMERNSI